MTHSENALLRDAADVVNAIALLSKVYEDGSTPLMASLDGGRVIACIEALTARVSELARAHADTLEENARLTRECEFHARQCARVDELRHRAEAELAAERERADRNQEDALTLMRALIKVRQQMFPQHDQRAVVSRDFPKLAAIDSARRK